MVHRYVSWQGQESSHKMATNTPHKMATATQTLIPKIPNNTNRCGCLSQLMDRGLEETKGQTAEGGESWRSKSGRLCALEEKEELWTILCWMFDLLLPSGLFSVGHLKSTFSMWHFSSGRWEIKISLNSDSVPDAPS